jgi:hypothetical protein
MWHWLVLDLLSVVRSFVCTLGFVDESLRSMVYLGICAISGIALSYYMQIAQAVQHLHVA